MILLFLVVISCLAVFSHGAGCPRIVCYHTNWSQYRPGIGKFKPNNIDPNLCTHINYAFAKMVGNQLRAFEWNDESTAWSKGMYDIFIDTKQRNPNVKLLLSVGGWNMGSSAFSAMVRSAAGRHEFATTSVKFLRDHHFDGLDLDWEYPAGRGSPPQDKAHYTELVKDLRSVFNADTSGPTLLLTAAVPAGKPHIDAGYDIPEIVKYFDFLNLMTYDLHGSWETFTGHNSPLYASSKDTGEQAYLNIDWAANYWVSKGAPKDKLTIGLGTYGRSFTLSSTTSTGLHATTRSKGQAGRYTREGGFLSYYEICDMQKSGGVVHRITEQGDVPYLVSGTQWVGYDDQESLRIKVQYVKHHNFGGVMVWALDLDDFSGSSCGQGPYPLLNTINSECSSTSSGPVFTRPPTLRPPDHTRPGIHVSPVPHTTENPYIHHADTFTCFGKSDGFYASPSTCSEYYICAAQTSFLVKCASGLVFNPNNRLCDWEKNYHCVDGQKPPEYTTRPPFFTPRPTHAPIQTTHRPYITAKPPTGTGLCSLGDGIHADPSDCNHYVECTGGKEYHFNCAPGTVYNDQIHNCDFPVNVPQCGPS